MTSQEKQRINELRSAGRSYQAIADEDENGFTAANAATFLESVYAPAFASGN